MTLAKRYLYLTKAVYFIIALNVVVSLVLILQGRKKIEYVIHHEKVYPAITNVVFQTMPTMATNSNTLVVESSVSSSPVVIIPYRFFLALGSAYVTFSGSQYYKIGDYLFGSNIVMMDEFCIKLSDGRIINNQFHNYKKRETENGNVY